MATTGKASELERGDQSGTPPSEAFELGASPSDQPSDVKETWKHPRSNILKTIACFWSFAIAGLNDGAYGALLTYIESYYGLTYTVVSIIFLAPFIGYIAAAALCNKLHLTFGQRGIAIGCSSCHLIAFLMMALHPPYPVLVIAFLIAGLGNGLAEGGWNAYIGRLERANELLGLLHGAYAFGAVISPLVATAIITETGAGWYVFYYILIGLTALECAVVISGFWDVTASKYKKSILQHADDSGAAAASEGGGGSNSRLRDALIKRPLARITWLTSAFLLGYVGIEVALGGWIITFMMQVRQGEAFASGMVGTGFWLGIAFGRVILGFVTPKIGERLAISIYLALIIALELIFWLVPQFIVSAVAVSLQGFFLGPLFPAAIVVLSKLLPPHLHVGVIGFAAAVGGSGGAVLPFAIGAIAQAKGVQVLQPVILALAVVITILWFLLPRINKKIE
ncbi:hypothetical protein E8E14_005265 [Neopestalotiopsis sp. 37M]|nr:hypothetical protein E8E14_005265 [Neopestalotiopsis sp. 37M]